MLHEWGRSGIEVDADFIYRILNNCVQGFCQLLLVHIVLILTDSDSLGIDLDQLCQRILYSSGDGSRTSLTNIKMREFLGCKLAGGVDRSSCLVGYHVLYRCVKFTDELGNHHL